MPHRKPSYFWPLRNGKGVEMIAANFGPATFGRDDNALTLFLTLPLKQPAPGKTGQLYSLPALGRQMPAVAGWHLEGGVTVVEYPSPQSVILFGQEGLRQDDPDFFAAYILNEVLGGGRFSARLMTELREKRGLTYGVSSFLAPMDYAQAYMGQMATANATVAESVELIRQEWQRLATEGITAEELAATKTYMTGAYPLRFDGNAEIADILVGMQMDGFPIDYPATRNAKVEAVTLDDVKRVAARLLVPEELHFVVVGQPDGVVSTE